MKGIRKSCFLSKESHPFKNARSSGRKLNRGELGRHRLAPTGLKVRNREGSQCAAHRVRYVFSVHMVILTKSAHGGFSYEKHRVRRT